MRWIFAALLVLAGFFPAPAQTLAPAPFTSQFARALQGAMPSASIAVVRDLQLNVRRADGTSATVNLDNVYRDYSSDPKRLDQLVRAYATALAQSARAGSAKLDPANIVPLIKHRPWLTELQTKFKEQNAAQQPVFDDFNNELAIVYAEDADNRTRYLSSAEDLGVVRGELRALAVANLRRVLPKIEMHQGDNGVSMITSHPDYGASLLLIDDIWSGGQIKVEGDLVVAVPAKDVVLVTGSRNRKGLAAMRAAAADLVKGPYGLIDTLFAYRSGKFVRFGRN
jgi:uncharacterized protein YtpQ (UPF0354 family)